MMASLGRSLVESEGALFGFVPGAAGTGYASTGTVSPGTTAVGGRGAVAPPAVTIEGPFDRTGAPIETPNRRKVFVCRPTSRSAQHRDSPEGAAGAASAEESACASRIMASLARRAFRRPVTDTDLAPLMQFYADGRNAGTFENGIENALTAMLSSAKFLYRSEPPPPNAQPGTIYRLSDIELASRLSFFLWSSIPDDTLLDLAARGRLKTPGVLDQQVRRMLVDERSQALVSNLVGQWLQLRNLDAVQPSSALFPDFDETLRQALRRETELFFHSILREDRSAVELLTEVREWPGSGRPRVRSADASPTSSDLGWRGFVGWVVRRSPRVRRQPL